MGNKIDSKYREVTEVEAKKFSKKMGMIYFEVSAKTGQNIPELISKVMAHAVNKVHNETMDAD